MIKPLNQDQWQRTISHPQYQKEITLWSLLGMYAWHGKHHLAQITSLKQRNKLVTSLFLYSKNTIEKSSIFVN